MYKIANLRCIILHVVHCNTYSYNDGTEIDYMHSTINEWLNTTLAAHIVQPCTRYSTLYYFYTQK